MLLAGGGGVPDTAMWTVVSDWFMLGAAFFLLISMALMLARLVLGPTLYDRLLALNSFGTKTVLFLCVFCFVIDRPDGIDIAILYALMNFIATIAVLKFFRYRALDIDLMGEHVRRADAREPKVPAVPLPDPDEVVEDVVEDELGLVGLDKGLEGEGLAT